MVFFVAICIGILVYVVLKFLLGLVAPLASIAEVVAIVVGILAAIMYAGGLK
jgi:hypothetical protein